MATFPRRRFMQGSTLAIALACAAACSNKDSGSSSGGPVAFEGTGPITWVQGKDNSGGKVQERIDEWNKLYPDEEVKLIELSAEADQQRSEFINNAQTGSSTYDVISVDNIWVSEFAANQWIVELPADELKNDDIIQAVWDTGVYREKFYAMPFATDAPIMFYRKDLLDQAGAKVPTTWDEVKAAVDAVRKLEGYESIGGFGGQWAKYEGLTCNISEFIHTAGGAFYDDQGKLMLNSPESIAGMTNAVNGFKDGYIPKEALEWKEEDGRNAFESGKVLFYRQWPYQYANNLENLGTEKFGVAALPSIDGKDFVPTLGGHNCGITTNCKNKATALKFVKWFTNEESERYALDTQTLAPILGSLYEDAEMLEKFPYLPILKDSLDKAKGRPHAVQYGDVTAAIQDATYPAIKGETTAEEAIKSMETTLQGIES
ncbi:ABC transporter substrate-binding protein [Actinomyces bowdenii]|uniref:ABC transporter substrate-binding protein n=1 Tax=Actinomyces bowdenii TaxID=131109 RepID=A0A853EK41_9ACTO|nr:ABC transporter substrate-binding protein [Actinomyces bowdenii]MBF0696043.1 ABC transporter substrate-binding protein [Actinomyces bowdenii]MDO5063527.1 ABC transporter substrate-binding protein [Actinomyces bowdenii]NYS68216.1 ABC transporter substrate-binding protein [Actinomyces bowdenii]